MQDHQAAQVSSRLALALCQHNHVYDTIIRPRGIEFVQTLKKNRALCIKLDKVYNASIAERKKSREERYSHKNREEMTQIEEVSERIRFPIRPVEMATRWLEFHRENRTVLKKTWVNAVIFRIRNDPNCPIQLTDRRLQFAGRVLQTYKALENLKEILILYYI